MRSLTPSERQKAILLGALLLLVANLLLVQTLWKQRGEREATLRQLRAETAYAEAWLSERELWDERRTWIAENQPVTEDLAQANVQLLELVQSIAKQNNLTVLDPQLGEPKRRDTFQETSVSMRLVGSLESLCRWTVALQQPNQFCAITEFSVKSDTDATKVRCDVRVAKWFR